MTQLGLFGILITHPLTIPPSQLWKVVSCTNQDPSKCNPRGLQAASKGDLEGVRKQVEALLYLHHASSTRDAPQPAWLYNSLTEAVCQDSTDTVRYLLDHDAANGEFPAETAVRARVRCIAAVPRSRLGYQRATEPQ